MMKTYSFYHKDSGLFTDYRFCATDETSIAVNTPPDHIAINGSHDHLSRRMDIVSGKVVNYKPPRPNVGHEWDSKVERWKLNSSAQSQKDAASDAIIGIQILEAKQLRVLRELALGIDGAKDRLQSIDDSIAALRLALTSNSSHSDS